MVPSKHSPAKNDMQEKYVIVAINQAMPLGIGQFAPRILWNMPISQESETIVLCWNKMPPAVFLLRRAKRINKMI